MKSNRGVVIVSGPQGRGKSKNAEQLRKMFGCRTVVDEWDGKSKLPAGALVLTNVSHNAATQVFAR